MRPTSVQYLVSLTVAPWFSFSLQLTMHSFCIAFLCHLPYVYIYVIFLCIQLRLSEFVKYLCSPIQLSISLCIQYRFPPFYPLSNPSFVLAHSLYPVSKLYNNLSHVLQTRSSTTTRHTHTQPVLISVSRRERSLARVEAEGNVTREGESIGVCRLKWQAGGVYFYCTHLGKVDWWLDE